MSDLDSSAGEDVSATVDVNQGMTYDVDIVLCIDATASMTPVIEAVKSRALQLPDDLRTEMHKKDKNVTDLRIKVVAFRDVDFDDVPFMVSEFFTMPDERAGFETFMRTVTAQGGGDIPESGLEALGIAMNSDWSNKAIKRRHLVVMFTDAPAHPIENSAGKIPAAFAGSVPSSMDELADLWFGSQTSKIDAKARRMVLFAPGDAPWSDLEADWDEVIHFPSQAGNGLADFEYSEILDLLVQSI